MADLMIDMSTDDLHSVLERVKKPGSSFSINGTMIGHVISLTEPERARLETLLRIAVSDDAPHPTPPLATDHHAAVGWGWIQQDNEDDL